MNLQKLYKIFMNLYYFQIKNKILLRVYHIFKMKKSIYYTTANKNRGKGNIVPFQTLFDAVIIFIETKKNYFFNF